MSHTTNSYLLILPNYYGKGDTLEDAFKAVKKAGYKYPKGKRKAKALAVVFSCTTEEVQAYGEFGVNWKVPPGTNHMELELTV